MGTIERAMEAVTDGQEPIAFVGSGGGGAFWISFNSQNFSGFFSSASAEAQAISLTEQWRETNGTETIGSPVPMIRVRHNIYPGNRTTYSVICDGQSDTCDDKQSALIRARQHIVLAVLGNPAPGALGI